MWTHARHLITILATEVDILWILFCCHGSHFSSPFVQRCVTLYVSMVAPVLSQVYASVHMDFMEPNVRMVIFFFSFSSCCYEVISKKALLSFREVVYKHIYVKLLWLIQSMFKKRY